MKQTKLQQAARALLTWRAKPNLFVTEVLKATPEPWQANALQALADDDRVSIRSGHGVGKSALDAWAILWFMATRFPCKVPCTANTATQLKDVLWSELAHWHRKMPPAFKEQFEHTAERFVLKSNPEESFAVPRTSRKEKPEALQGFHSPNLLFVIDEASGVEEVVFEVSEGALSTKGAKVLMTSNPTRTTGYFWASHHKEKNRWHRMKVSCEESSQVNPSYIQEMAEKYGKDSNVYRVRVLGEFPTGDDDAIIPLSLIESAVGRDVEVARLIPVWGVDVARYGDDRSVLIKRHSNKVPEPPKVWRDKDTMQLAGLIKNEFDATSKKYKPKIINVDVIGIGAGVVDRLKEMDLPVRGVNVAERPAVKDKYMRLRDELWFEAREWFEGLDVSIPEGCEELVNELATPGYKVLSNGKLQAESKDDIKRKGLDSPDLADGFCLTFANQGMQSRDWDKPIEYDDDWII